MDSCWAGWHMLYPVQAVTIALLVKHGDRAYFAVHKQTI